MWTMCANKISNSDPLVHFSSHLVRQGTLGNVKSSLAKVGCRSLYEEHTEVIWEEPTTNAEPSELSAHRKICLSLR